jgi:hypothetical protein
VLQRSGGQFGRRERRISCWGGSDFQDTEAGGGYCPDGRSERAIDRIHADGNRTDQKKQGGYSKEQPGIVREKKSNEVFIFA